MSIRPETLALLDRTFGPERQVQHLLGHMQELIESVTDSPFDLVAFEHLADQVSAQARELR